MRGTRRECRSGMFGKLLAISCLASLSIPAMAVEPVVIVRVDRSTQIGTSHFSIGVTHTQPKWESGNPQAVARAKALLTAGLKYQNQHLMDWGTENPEPKPGVFHWMSLDERIALIRSMGAIPVITLCTAPGWMKTSGEDFPHQTGPDSWADDRVADNHVKDFVELSKKVVLRYPDVKYFQIWNEYKGYWDKAANNWDAVRFTDFYNAVYDAIKSVRPDAKLGGPYYPFDGPQPRDWQVIDYWFKHKHGADFVCFDGWVAGYPPTRERSEEARKMTLTEYFGNIAVQFRARTTLPIWISEFYGGWSSNPQFTAANHASCYLHALLNGVSVALLWDAELQKWNYLFTSTKTPDGGRPSPHYQVVKIFNTEFGAGTKLYKCTSSSPDVEVLASGARTLLINKRDAEVRVQVNNRDVVLAPYDVRLLKQ
jgi:Glycosyl hydrolases family 39